MQITFNRSDLYRFERLVNKLVKPSELPTMAIFAPCSGGTMLIAFCENATLTLTVPDVNMSDTFSLPWPTMKELASKKDSVVELDVSDSIITATWSVNGIPQQKQYLSPKPTDKRLPHLPENNVTHSMQLFDVLDNAGKGSVFSTTSSSTGLTGGSSIALVFPFFNDGNFVSA